VDDGVQPVMELAAIYDAIYGGREDAGFWWAAAAAAKGPLLELGCGTGRVLLPLARAGFEITGLDLSAPMLQRCSAKLQEESQEIRDRARLVAADMTAFDLGRRFAAILCPFAGFQQLRRVDQQLACLDRCRRHLRPQGRLVLDLPNPDPAPAEYARDEPGGGEVTAQVVDWTDGRRIRWSMTVTGYDRLQQVNECEVTYEIIESDGAPPQRDTSSALHVPLRARAPARTRWLPGGRPVRRLRLFAVRGRLAGADRRGRTARRLSPDAYYVSLGVRSSPMRPCAAASALRSPPGPRRM
jgi:SAM-dependent methyltransferase